MIVVIKVPITDGELLVLLDLHEATDRSKQLRLL